MLGPLDDIGREFTDPLQHGAPGGLHPRPRGGAAAYRRATNHPRASRGTDSPTIRRASSGAASR